MTFHKKKDKVINKSIFKQSIFIQSLSKKLKEVDDPDPDVITHNSYEYHSVTLKHFGIVPKLTFKPYGKSTQIKAEIMRSTNLDDESRQQEINEIRKEYGLKTARDTEIRILARLFESYWNNYWRSIKTALGRIEQAQKLFITKPNQTLSEPMKILMGDKAISIDKADKIGNKDDENKKDNENMTKIEKKTYAEELMEVD